MKTNKTDLPIPGVEVCVHRALCGEFEHAAQCQHIHVEALGDDHVRQHAELGRR